MAAAATRTPAEARRKLEVLKRFLLMTAVIYLGLHFWVTFAVFRQTGLLAAATTLLTLGFGDLYWAWNWWSDASVGAVRDAAVGAAAMAFLSWGTRPWTNAYLMRLGLDSIRAFPPEPEVASRTEAEPPRPSGGAVADRRPGGAS